MLESTLAEARILVVDDEEANVDLLEQMLARAGYQHVVSTTDPRRVLALYREHQPDLILLDLLMPYLDGFEVLNRLQTEIPVDAFVPILVLTAVITPEAKRRALDSGATDFLTKPFDHIELLLRIRNLLRTRTLSLQQQAQVARLERLYDETQRSLTLRTQEMTALTHDLGQPLTSMRLVARALRQRQAGALDPEIGGLLDEELSGLESTINRMLDMVGEMLDLARLESGRPLDLNYRPTDLVALARGEVEALRSTSASHPIDLIAAAPTLLVECDASRIGRVIANLLSNAIKYSPAGGPITVSVGRKNDTWAEIEVRDAGIGIPASDLPHVFEAYRRGGNVTGRIGGTGIGLAGASRIVEQHGGSIRVESVEGKGSTFTVCLLIE